MRGRILLLTAVAAVVPVGRAAAAGDPIMPLSAVRQGMQCTGYSVFRGTAVEPFPVEILDVVGQSVSGEAATRLLVRASGPKVDDTGIGAGFSGSPIYCPMPDGTLANAGAISETIGAYDGKTVLATPIEQIVGTPVDAPVAPAARVAPAHRAGTIAHTATAVRDARLLARAKPLAAPLTVAGLGREVYRDLARAAARRGVTLLQAPPTPVTAPGPQRLVPGSAVGVGMSSGDISVGAVGTVAYTDGPSTWVFGHEFDGVGARQLLLQDAYVAAIIGNPVQTSDGGGTYKLSGPVNDLGEVTDDGMNAVAGRTGALPPTVPVRVYTKDADRNVERDLQVKVADETGVGNPTGISNLSFIAPLAVSEGATDVLGAAPLRVAGNMCFQAVVKELAAPLRFCNRYVSDGTAGSFDGSVGNLVALAAGTDATGALSLFDTYKGDPLHITEVSARISLTRGQRQAYLRGIDLPRHVTVGREVRGELRVKLVRGAKRTIPFRWRVPLRLTKGTHRLTFVGSGPDGSEDLFDTITLVLGDDSETTDTEGPRSATQIAAAFRSFHRWDGVRLKGSGVRVYRNPTYRIGGTARATLVVSRPRRG